MIQLADPAPSVLVATPSPVCPPARVRAAEGKNAQLPALTGLRFVLALWVVLHHLTGKGMMLEPWAASLPAEVRAIIRGGYLAVSTFFVLSGFVLALSYRQNSWTRTSLIRYGVARLARVYPNYLLSLLIISPFIRRVFAHRWNPCARLYGEGFDAGTLLVRVAGLGRKAACAVEHSRMVAVM